MSDSIDHSNSSTTNTPDTTEQQATSLPMDPPITSNPGLNLSSSSMGTHAVIRGLVNGNHQAPRTTPIDNDINNDHQTGDNAPNDQGSTPPSAMMTVDYTNNPTVRRLHEAFHTDASQFFTLASDLMRPMAARERQEFGLQPDTSQSGMASHNNRSTSSEPTSFDIFDAPNTVTPPAAVGNTPVTLGMSQVDDSSSSGALQHGPPAANSSESPSVSQAADFSTFGFHASELPSFPMRHPTPVSGATALFSHPLRRTSATVGTFDYNTDEGPRNTSPRPSYSSTDLGLRSESVPDNGGRPYSQPNPTSDSSNRAASTNAQDSTNTVVGDAPSVNVSDLQVEPVGRERLDELAPPSQYSEDEAAPDERATENSSVAPVRRRVLVASRHPVGGGRNPSPAHGSTPNNNTPRDDGRPVYLSDYLREASPSVQDRRAWNGRHDIPLGNNIEDRANNTSTNAQANSTNVNSVMRNATPQERELLGLEGFHGR